MKGTVRTSKKKYVLRLQDRVMKEENVKQELTKLLRNEVKKAQYV